MVHVPAVAKLMNHQVAHELGLQEQQAQVDADGACRAVTAPAGALHPHLELPVRQAGLRCKICQLRAQFATSDPGEPSLQRPGAEPPVAGLAGQRHQPFPFAKANLVRAVFGFALHDEAALDGRQLDDVGYQVVRRREGARKRPARVGNPLDNPSYLDPYCVDTPATVRPPENVLFESGTSNELMIIRACLEVSPVWGFTMIGGLAKQDPDGQWELHATTVFVHEPFGGSSSSPDEDSSETVDVADASN